MRKYLMPIYLVLFLMGATALWYFGHHRPAQKILEAEPKRVYKTIPLQPEDSSVKPTPSDAIQKPREADIDRDAESIDIESEDMANTATPKKMDKDDKNQDQVEDTSFDKLVPQEGLETEDPAAAEAYEKYFTAESEYLAAQDRLKAALDVRPIDWDLIESATNDSENAARHRKEALQNLAPYSEEAAKLLEEMEKAEKTAEEIMSEIREDDTRKPEDIISERLQPE